MLIRTPTGQLQEGALMIVLARIPPTRNMHDIKPLPVLNAPVTTQFG
jgi:hypothetical protein